MQTLITYIPKCTFINSAYTITVIKEVYYRDNDSSKWASLSPKQEESIVPVNPIGYGNTAVYLTEAGALSHPHWIREYNNEGYRKLHPVWDLLEFPGMVDHTKNAYYTVTIIDGRLVEVEKNSIRLYTPFSTDVDKWERNAEIALQAMKSPNPDAAIQLLGLIMFINFNCWGGHWLSGTQWELLGLLSKVRDNPKASIKHTMYGNACIIATHMADLIKLQKQSDGWWTYDPDEKKFYFAVNN